MKEQGVLLFGESYEHRYPHCWRCHNPVIFRATPQWFISMDNAGGNEVVEKDDDGRAIESFENYDETAEPLRSGALREIERVEWVPSWGADRMRNMLKNRPDWCVSRQRVWGVPIPVFYCADCNAAVADPAIVNHVADIFEKESADAWYAREAKDLLPEGFRCSGCGGDRWTKETDILDVWFDSGSSSIAVLERRANLRWPADVYIEGGDQYRGWFNSSLMVGLAAHDRAPFKTVLTHGWVVDGQGKAMHKSTGNAVSPNEVIKESGAEILRLWTASTDYHEDMRCSNEILQRISDTYRKLRNTARYALGNLDGFEPARDSVADSELVEIDRWALAELDSVIKKVREAYDAYEFHLVYHALYNFATVTLSARYFDIIKDRLYTAAPRSHARRSAQTALFRIADALARLLAPILVFTSDEIWENLPRTEENGLASVHLAQFPDPAGVDDWALRAEWEALFKVRDQVLRTLEDARTARVIGSSLEARVDLVASGGTFELLERHKDDLRYIFIVSQVSLSRRAGEESSELSVRVDRAEGKKCERCWNYSTRVGESERYPTVCERCAAALEEIESEN
jgi:isoleucyl-tRNA synthetase